MPSSAVQGEGMVWSPLAASLSVAMLGYVIKALLHTHRGAQGNNSRCGSPGTTCLAYSRPIIGLISPSKAHLHKPRRTQRHQHKREPKVRTQKGHPVLAPPRTVPGEPQLHCPGMKPFKMSQVQSTFQTEWSLPKGNGTYYGMQRKSIWGQDYLWDVWGRNHRQGKGWI